jgi:hypothetical protein
VNEPSSNNISFALFQFQAYSRNISKYSMDERRKKTGFFQLKLVSHVPKIEEEKRNENDCSRGCLMILPVEPLRK